MTSSAGGASDNADEMVWWYRDGGATQGPVSLTDLRRLSTGPLGPAMLVWKKTFGDRWTRLDAMLSASRASDLPPSVDYGRWTKSFESFAANPRASQWSWLGLFGPLAYLRFGMWRRALIIFAFALAFQVLFALADYGTGNHAHVLPGISIALFCARNLKRDYYDFKVLGEPMWPRLRVMRNGFACAAPAVFLLIALVALKVTNPADVLIAEVDGVWQSDGASVVIDVGNDAKTITYGGSARAVRLASVDDENGIIVFEDIRHPERTITLRKHWTEEHDKYSIDLIVDDRMIANLVYLRPV